MTARVDPDVEIVLELITVTDWLAASLLPGNDNPYRPELSADRKTERRQQQLADRILEAREDLAAAKTRGNFALPTTAPLGHTPAPANVAIMDLLDEILTVAVAHSGLPSPRYSFEDPRPHLRAAAHRGDDPHRRRLIDVCEQLIDTAHSQLGLMGDGHLLKVVCPWCKGITGTHPEGGQQTLRFRAKLPEGKRSLVGVSQKDIRWLIVCESGACEPPSKDCGTWWHGRPAWDLASEGDFLAKHLSTTLVS